MSARELKEKLIKGVFSSIAALSILFIFFIFIFLFVKAYPAIEEFGASLLTLKWEINSDNLLKSQFGLLSHIFGTVAVGIGAMIVAIPLGISAAVYLSELASNKIRVILKPLIELLAGIPSVVYGFVGALLLGKWLQASFGMQTINSLLAAALILGIMALPIIVSLSDDALKAVPKDMKDASLALGASKWQTTKKVTIPSAISGISSSVIMGFGRAIGETMAVLMVIGAAEKLPMIENLPFIGELPFDIFETTTTLTAGIAGGAPVAYGVWINVLFVMGIILFVIVMCTSILSEILQHRTKLKFEGKL